MWIFRALAGSVLWLLAGILGLVGALLCVTIILLPLGIPVLGLAKKLFAYSMVFFLPRKVRHPVDELKKSASGATSDAVDKVTDADLGKAGKKVRKKAGKRWGALLGAGRSFLEHQRKRVA